MTPRFSYQPIVLALLATLVLAGLFYLPYLSVRTKTIDAFYTQQMLLAQQAGSGMQSYFATYTKALTYLSEQGAIKTMEDSGKALLLDFFPSIPKTSAIFNGSMPTARHFSPSPRTRRSKENRPIACAPSMRKPPW